MRVLHIIPSIGPLRGGPSYAVLNICRALAQAGVEVTLATTDDNGPAHLDVPLKQSVLQDNYTTIYFRRTAREYTFSWSITPWLTQHIESFDFVHIHAVFSYTSVLGGILANLRNVPYAIRPAGILLSWGVKTRRTSAKRLHYRIFEDHILNGAAFVHAMSQAEANELYQLKIRTPIEVIYHGLEKPKIPTETNETSWSRDKLALLFIGRFHAKKGLDLLLPAFAKALEQDSRLLLLLAGDGEAEFKAWMKDEITKLGLDDYVRWLGFLQGEEKWRTISSSTAVIMPSYSENFGLVVAEAMMCGTPIIVSEAVALANEVADAQAGLVVPCKIEPLTEAIITLASNETLRQEMGENAKMLAGGKFPADKNVDKLIEAYSRYCR